MIWINIEFVDYWIKEGEKSINDIVEVVFRKMLDRGGVDLREYFWFSCKNLYYVSERLAFYIFIFLIFFLNYVAKCYNIIGWVTCAIVYKRSDFTVKLKQ